MTEPAQRRAERAAEGHRVADEPELAHAGVGAEAQADRRIGRVLGDHAPQAGDGGQGNAGVGIPNLALVELGLSQERVPGYPQLGRPFQMQERQAREPGGFVHVPPPEPLEYPDRPGDGRYTSRGALFFAKTSEWRQVVDLSLTTLALS